MNELKEFKIMDIYGDEFIYKCESLENALECFKAENGKDRLGVFEE